MYTSELLERMLVLVGFRVMLACNLSSADGWSMACVSVASASASGARALLSRAAPTNLLTLAACSPASSPPVKAVMLLLNLAVRGSRRHHTILKSCHEMHLEGAKQI